MKTYLDEKNGSKEFKAKDAGMQRVINEALFILDCLGLPLEGSSSRSLEKMALAFLATVGVASSKDWPTAKDLKSGRTLKTREMIIYINENFAEKISPGSYDDIRRKALLLPHLAEIIVNSKPNAAQNDSTRGYALNPAYTDLIRSFSPDTEWAEEARAFMADRVSLAAIMSGKRDLEKIQVKLPQGKEIAFSQGKHNLLQKAVIDEFLTRYGYGADVLYVGDTADKDLVLEKEKLEGLKFFELDHGKLPDIVAYCADKNWLYLIEAVHSSGPISEERKIQLERLTAQCTAEIVYVTAFLDKETYRKFAKDIAWETEVWIAGSPDHLIHFNGGKFLGPYKKNG